MKRLSIFYDMVVKRKEGGKNMLQKIQRFGGAMFTPVLLFAFAGTVIGIGTLFTTEAIMGGIANPDGLCIRYGMLFSKEDGQYLISYH